MLCLYSTSTFCLFLALCGTPGQLPCLYDTPHFLPPQSIESMFMLINLSASLSGRPNNACSSPGTTKTDMFFMFLCSNIYLHVPNCVIMVFSYNFNSMCLFTVATNCSLGMLGNSFFEKICWHYIAIAAHVYSVFYIYTIFSWQCFQISSNDG